MIRLGSILLSFSPPPPPQISPPADLPPSVSLALGVIGVGGRQCHSAIDCVSFLVFPPSAPVRNARHSKVAPNTKFNRLAPRRLPTPALVTMVTQPAAAIPGSGRQTCVTSLFGEPRCRNCTAKRDVDVRKNVMSMYGIPCYVIVHQSMYDIAVRNMPSPLCNSGCFSQCLFP